MNILRCFRAGVFGCAVVATGCSNGVQVRDGSPTDAPADVTTTNDGGPLGDSAPPSDTMCGDSDTQTSLANCGRCDHACPTVVTANAVPACNSGTCGFVCNAGFAADLATGQTCLPILPPRLIAPLSTSTVTSLRPTLHTQLDRTVASDSIRVEVCSDNACAHPVVSGLTATGQNVTIPTALAPDTTYFWRAYGQLGANSGTTASAVWEFRTPGPSTGRSAITVDSSSGTFVDFNGDGLADVAVGGPGTLATTRRAYLYLATVGGIDPSNVLLLSMLTSPDDGSAQMGTSIASAGDVNGDGYGDLIVGAPNGAHGGHAYIYFGSGSGHAGAPSVTFNNADGSFGTSVAGLGDVNGDGYGDVIVGVPNSNSAYVFLGNVDFNAANHVIMQAANQSRVLRPSIGLAGTEQIGASVAGAGDVNGDGLADMVVGAPGVNTDAGGAYLFLGTTTGFASTTRLTVASDLSIGAVSGEQRGVSVASAGDVDADGYVDVVIGAPGAADALVFHGVATGLRASPATIVGSGIMAERFGASVAGAGDLNGDGYADLIVGEPAASPAGAPPQSGRVYLFAGATGVLPQVQTLVPTDVESTFNGHFGASVAGAGDINNDGFMDLVIGTPGAGSTDGRASVWTWDTATVHEVRSTVLPPSGAGLVGGMYGAGVAWLWHPTRRHVVWGALPSG